MDLVKEIIDIIETVHVGDIYKIVDTDEDRSRSIGTKVRIINTTDKSTMQCRHKECCNKTSKKSCIEFVNVNNPYDTIWSCYCTAELIRKVDI